MAAVQSAPAADGSALGARAQILLAALLFSTGGVVIKGCTMSSWQVASFRSGIATVAVLVMLPAARRGWTWRPLVVGLAYAGTLILYVTGNKLTTAADTIFLQSTAPLYLLLFAPWLLGERNRGRDLLFMVALALGMLLFFVGTEPPSRTAPDPLHGNLAALASGLSWALTLTGLRWLGREGGGGGAARAIAAGNLLAFLAALPWALPVVRTVPADWLSLAFLGVFQIGVAYVFLTRGMRRVGALEASLLLLLEPVLNPIWTWLVHGERPGVWALAGGAVILATTTLKSWIDSPQRPGPDRG